MKIEPSTILKDFYKVIDPSLDKETYFLSPCQVCQIH